MESYEIQKLRDIPIEGVAGRLGLSVNRHKSLCPFHDDHTPSLTFNVARNKYKCYACGASGDTISLAMGVLANNSFLEACRWLANSEGIILDEYKSSSPKVEVRKDLFDAERYARYFEHPWLSPDACKFLFEKRHLNPAVVKYCRLNSFRDWLQIPYFNREGKLIGIQSRYMGTDPAQPRFRFPYGNGCHTYNLPVLKMLHQGEDLYITEGPSDCWAMLSAGHKAIAIPSATLLNKKELQSELTEAHLLENENTLHIYPDSDRAGESLFKELLSVATDMGLLLVRHDLPDGCKDFADLWTTKALSVKC